MFKGREKHKHTVSPVWQTDRMAEPSLRWESLIAVWSVCWFKVWSSFSFSSFILNNMDTLTQNRTSSSSARKHIHIAYALAQISFHSFIRFILAYPENQSTIAPLIFNVNLISNEESNCRNGGLVKFKSVWMQKGKPVQSHTSSALEKWTKSLDSPHAAKTLP